MKSAFNFNTSISILILFLAVTFQFWKPQPAITMSTQAALVVQQIGQPLISIHDFPIAKPGPGQIQVRVTVAGLNPHDHKARDWGLFIKDNLPSSLANDVVGEVTVLGEGVTRFKVGDVVFSQAAFVGLQQYALLEEDFTAIVPEGISQDEAATLPTNIIAGENHRIPVVECQNVLTHSKQAS